MYQLSNPISIPENKFPEDEIKGGYVVYIAMEKGKVSNFDLQTHDGQHVIYAADTPEQAMACILNPKHANMCKAIVYPQTFGYLPITQSREDDYDMYVNNIHDPSIFLLKPNKIKMNLQSM